MGHFVLKHTYALIAASTAIGMGSLFTLYKAGNGIISKFSSSTGIRSMDDPAATPLLTVLMGLLSFVLTPAMFALTRHFEREADQFGIELTRNNKAAATSFVKMQKKNLGVPEHGWLFTLFRGSHPSIAKRVAFLNNYRPWEKGERLRYEHHFKQS